MIEYKRKSEGVTNGKITKRYETEFKQHVVRLVSEEGRTIASVNQEFQLGEGTVQSWIRQFQEE